VLIIYHNDLHINSSFYINERWAQSSSLSCSKKARDGFLPGLGAAFFFGLKSKSSSSSLSPKASFLALEAPPITGRGCGPEGFASGLATGLLYAPSSLLSSFSSLPPPLCFAYAGAPGPLWLRRFYFTALGA